MPLPMPPTRRALLLTAALAVPAPRPRAAAAQPAAFSLPAWTDAWEAVLQRRVDAQGRVDFAGLQAEPDPLRAVVQGVATIAPRSRPELFPTPPHRLAYYINAYNALAMHGIVERGVPDNLGLLGRFAFFVNTEFPFGGRRISLKSLEDDVIRPLGEERVHFALNCMVRACPRLPREAFRPERLEAQLAAAAREFCDSGYHVRPDPPNRRVWISEIFKFYTADFVPAKAPSLLAYINRWRSRPLPDNLRVEFLDYDWAVNRQPTSGGVRGAAVR